MNGTTFLTPSPTLGAVRWPSDGAREWVADLLARVRDGKDVVAVVAYGSAVRECVTSSDVDLLVIARGAFAASPAPLDVDLRVVMIEEVEAALANGDEVLGWAARFGVPLMEADAFWSSLVARWTGHLPFPSAEASDERAERAARYEQALRADGDHDAADEMRLTELTQRARARLLRGGVYPLSRPELPDQLTRVGADELARELSGRLHSAS
jgi:hypothetical protein